MAAKEFPKEWPPLIVREFFDVGQGYKAVRDLVRSLNDMRRKIVEVGNDHATLIDALPVPDFTSAEQTVAFDTLLDVAHSLGAVPTLYTIIMRCKTAELGYSVGDEVGMGSSFTAGALDRGITVSADATNITIVQGQTINLHVQSTLNSANITVGNWRWIMRAWK